MSGKNSQKKKKEKNKTKQNQTKLNCCALLKGASDHKSFIR